MTVRPAEPDDREQLARLIAAFRVELSGLRGRADEPDLGAAERELAGYESAGFPVFVACGEGKSLAGYLVCRVDGGTVWAESLYVLPKHRRQGRASALYGQAERLADERGSQTVYNWVDPENKAVIEFLCRRGYDVLNLIELRRPRDGEQPTGTVRVGSETFRR